MFEDRTIRLIGSIDEVAYETFTESLSALESEDDTPVGIELSSEGGTAYDALAIVSRMRLSNCGIYVIATGFVASAATIILAAGDTRYMASEAWVMMHEESGKCRGTVSSLEREVRHLRRMEDQWNKLLEKYTRKPASFWAKLQAKGDVYLTPDQCLKLGLIDKII